MQKLLQIYVQHIHGAWYDQNASLQKKRSQKFLLYEIIVREVFNSCGHKK